MDVDKLREKTAAVTVPYHGEKIHVRYYIGDKAKELERRLARNIQTAQAQYQERDEDGEEEELPEIDPKEFDRGRRELCETLCLMIASWDVSMTLATLVELVEDLEKEREIETPERIVEERREKYNGKGTVPLEPIFLDALPLPTSFHIKVSNLIGEDMAVGGKSGKGR